MSGNWPADWPLRFVITEGSNAGRITKLSTVLRAVLAERVHQDGKWGPLERQNDRHLPNWFETIEEELSEAVDDYYRIGRVAERDIFLELVQVAAVAIACLEQLAPDDLDELVRKHRGL